MTNSMGRIAGMIAYELVLEAGIASAAVATAGAASTLTAARLALIVNKLKKLGPIGDKVGDLLTPNGPLAKKLGELFSQLKKGGFDYTRYLDGLAIKCFARDTLVHTATGLRPIGEILPGDQVWAYRFEAGSWELCEVKERLDNTYFGPVISITVDSTTIEATAYHPFWVIEGRDLQERSRPRELQEHEDEGHSLPGRWVNSHELRAGDWIITRSGTRAIITEIRQHFEPAFPVSNLTILGHHNYSVGDVGVLVHNVSVCDGTIADLRKLRADGMSEDKINDWLRSKTDDSGNRLYNDDEIEKALEEILAPVRGVTKAGEELRSLVFTGWRKGKGAVHFDKHGKGLGYKSLKEYTDAAYAFAKKAGRVIEAKVGNLIFKYDHDTQMILIVSAKERNLVTFHKAFDGIKSFRKAMRDHVDVLRSQGAL